MKNYIQEGKAMKVLAGAAKTGGDVEVLTDCIGVWFTDVVSGSTGEVITEGVVKLPKNTSTAFTQGQKVFWSAVNGELTDVDTDIPAGLVWDVAATADISANIKLNAGVQAGTEAG